VLETRIWSFARLTWRDRSRLKHVFLFYAAKYIDAYAPSFTPRPMCRALPAGRSWSSRSERSACVLVEGMAGASTFSICEQVFVNESHTLPRFTTSHVSAAVGGQRIASTELMDVLIATHWRFTRATLEPGVRSA